MVKRYVFCRMPNGRPYRQNDGKFFPGAVFSELGSKSHLNAEGALTWDSFMMSKFEVPIRSAFFVVDPDDEELNESDTRRIIWDSITAILKRAPGKPINSTELFKEADGVAAAFFRQAPVEYLLVSSLSVRSLPAARISVRGHVIAPLAERGDRYPLPGVLGSRHHEWAFADHLKSTRYQLITVSTQGRSIHEATEKGLNALNVLRGVWSLFATYGSWSWSFGAPRRKPLGLIHTGPVHTLHLPDGKPAIDNMYWFDPDYVKDHDLFPDDRWRKAEKNRKWAIRRLAKIPYGRDVEQLLIRYVAALDQTRAEVAYLQMWAILEKITNTIGAKYDETIGRASWVFSPESRPIAKDLLGSVRYHRNQYVHSGRTSDESDQIAYLIKSFVDPHLARLIANPFKIKSLEEYGEFLAQPTDIATLERSRKMVIRALRFLKPRDGKKP